MKHLHEFTINKEQEVETELESKNEAGEIVITKRKEKQSVPYKFFIVRPNRNLADSAALYNSVQVNLGLRNNLMSVFQLDKKYREDGVFTDEDNQKFKGLYDSLIKNIDELQKLTGKSEDQRTDDEKARSLAITEEMSQTRLKLNEYENIKNNLYTHSAEYRARNKTITWWLLHLAYKDEGGKEVPFFTGNTLDEKLKFYDELLDKDDTFMKSIIDRFLYTVSFWVINNAEKPEDFIELDKFIEKEKKAELINNSPPPSF